MNKKTGLTLILVAACLVTSLAAAQSTPLVLVGCLDANGGLYNLVPKGQVSPQCSDNDMPVELGPGTISSISVGPGLVGGGESGDVILEVDPRNSLTPTCPPGHVPFSDDTGAWTCALPGNLNRTSNTGSTVWVVPSFVLGRNPADLDDSLRIRTAVAFLNPGNSTTIVQAQAFNEEGTPITLANPIKDIPPQGRRVFLANQQTAWLMAVSCNRVFATAFDRIGRQDGSGGFQIEAYPVDCVGARDDDFICKSAEVIRFVNCALPNPSDGF